MNIDKEANQLRIAYEHRKITRDELMRGLAHLDSVAAILEAPKYGKPIYIKPRD